MVHCVVTSIPDGMPGSVRVDELVRACDGCGLRLDGESVVCVRCGFDTRTDRPAQTRVRRLKDRGNARRRARAAQGTVLRTLPWILLLAQLVAVVALAAGAIEDARLRPLHERLAYTHLVLAVLVCSFWTIREGGLVALGSFDELAEMHLGSDSNPWVLSIVFGAAASIISLLVVMIATGSLF